MRILILILSLLFSGAAFADGQRNPCFYNLNNGCTAVKSSGSIDDPIIGNISVTNGTVTILTNGRSSVGLSVSGIFSGSLTVRVSVDYSIVGAANATWGTTTAISLASGTVVTGITSTGIYQINAGGFSAVQVFGTSIVSGVANISLLGTNGVSTVMADNPFPVTQTSLYPLGSVPITGNATGTTGAVIGTLAGATLKTTYICGFNVSTIGGTAAVGPITVAGLITNSMIYQLASSASGNTLPISFTPCIPSLTLNTPITITTTADGSATAVSVNSWGYQQ